MANFQFNISKGRMVEFCERVNSADGTDPGFIITLWTTIAARSVLEDMDDLAEIEAGTSVEAVVGTVTDYVRKNIQAGETAGMLLDDTDNDNAVDFDDIVWSGLGNGNNTAILSLIVVYADDVAGGADSTFIPCTHNDFAITPDDSDVTAQLPVGGLLVCS